MRQHALFLAGLALAALCAYLIGAYVIVPALWKRDERRHPALADAQTLTHTGSGIPGDPLNIGLVGSEADVHRAMLAAKWYPADAITLASSIRIVGDVVFDRPYHDAPVSNLYLWILTYLSIYLFIRCPVPGVAHQLTAMKLRDIKKWIPLRWQPCRSCRGWL